MKNPYLIMFSVIFLVLCIGVVSAERMPVPGGDDGIWSTILNNFLNVSLNDTGQLENDTVSSLQIVNGTIIDADISDTTNLTLGEKITFKLGEMIDNIVDGWIQITGGLNVRGSGNFSGTIYINNATDISSWEINISRNWTAMTFAGYNATWDNSWINTLANLQSVMNASGIYETYNATYDSFTLNVSRNWTAMTFDEWGNQWYNHTSEVFDTWDARWDNSWINTLANLQSVMNASGIYSTYNATYDDYALNVSRNWTEMAFDTWDTRWDDGVTIWDATFNASFDQRDSDTSYNATYALYNQTYNATYNNFILNVSLNYSEIVFDTWDARWNTGAATLWDAGFNASFDQRDSDTSYNATYDSFTLNVSLNYSEIVFDTWDAIWSAGTTLWDADFNASFADLDSDTITTIWDATFNASFDQRDKDTSYNATYALYNQTYNATYNNFILNVSLNYSEIVFDTWDSRWDDGVTIWDATFNASFVDLDSDTITTIWDATFNASFDQRDSDNSYNETYDSFTLNVSRNWTEMTFAGYNSTWDNSWINTLANLQSVMNASGIYETYNATYDSFTLNVSRNWTAMTFDEWGSQWYNHTSEVFDTWDAIWSAGTTLWDATFNASFDQRDKDTSYNATYALYNQTYNATYNNFILNVSLNYSEIVFDTWDSDWSGVGGNASWNESLAWTLFAPNMTAAIQSLINATGIYETYNATYDSFTLNVSRNWTEMTFAGYNSTWDNSWINTLANLQSVMNASGIYETYNATYDSFTLNVSRNWTAMTFDEWGSQWYNHTSEVFDTWDSRWDDGVTIWDATFNASFADLDSDTITTIWDAGFNASFDQRDSDNSYNETYDSFTLNVSRNWTEMTFAGYNSTWDNSWINTLANLQSVMNASGIYETYNATYDSFTLNVSRNWTAMTFDEWGSQWYNHTSEVFDTWDSRWDNSWINTLANLQSVMNTSGIYETYNATYNNFILNVSLNYSEIVFDTWDARWNTGAATLWDADFNASFDQRDSDNSFNETYDSFTLNVSLNYSEIVFDTWSGDWGGSTTLWDADFNASFADLDSDTITTIWDAGFNASFDQRDKDTSYNATYALYNQTYNATYNNFILNVSLNYSEIVFDTWDTDWSAQTTIWDATFNASFADLDSDTITTIWDATFNASFDQRDGINQFNATYDSFTLNVSRNWTAMTFAGYNSTWDNSWINTLANLQSVMNASGIYETYNATYDSFTLNVSRNWTAMTFDEWGSQWYNHTSEVFDTWDAIWSAGTTLWDATFNASFDQRDKDTSYNATYALYNQTYNATYNNFILNVSLNYSEIVFDTWSGDWGGSTTLWDATFNASFDQRDLDTQLTEDQVEALIFDADNTADLGMGGYNITATDCVKFESGGMICSGT